MNPPDKTKIENTIVMEPPSNSKASKKEDSEEEERVKSNNVKDSDENPKDESSSPAHDEHEEEESTFPQQLMDLIDAESKEGCGVMTTNGCINDDKGSGDNTGSEKEKEKKMQHRVIEWLPDGKSFVIRDKSKFESEVLPKYFRVKCKVMSFIRKLYRWVHN